MKKHWDDFFVPPEADEFLDKVKIDFAESFEVDDQFLSAWLSHHGESQGKWLRARPQREKGLTIIQVKII